MIRALLFAFGLTGTLLGAGLFYVDSILLTVKPGESQLRLMTLLCSIGEGGKASLDPAEWIPYTMVGMGALTVLYSLALPVRHFRHDRFRNHHHH